MLPVSHGDEGRDTLTYRLDVACRRESSPPRRPGPAHICRASAATSSHKLIIARESGSGTLLCLHGNRLQVCLFVNRLPPLEVNVQPLDVCVAMDEGAGVHEH